VQTIFGTGGPCREQVSLLSHLLVRYLNLWLSIRFIAMQLLSSIVENFA
jgi:hypothetical protein